MVIKKSKYADPPIPIRYRFTGDVEKGEALKGFAKQQFARNLEIDCANSHGKYLQENRKWPTIKSNLGELISIRLIKGVSFIDIFVPSGEEKGYIQTTNKCFCNCNFAIGKIITNYVINDLLYYSVSCCENDEIYVMYENILGSDFTPWQDGDTVLVMAYHDMLYDCDNNNFLASGCNPIEDVNNLVADEDWRTIVRIVPVCFLPFSKWLYYEQEM